MHNHAGPRGMYHHCLPEVICSMYTKQATIIPCRPWWNICCSSCCSIFLSLCGFVRAVIYIAAYCSTVFKAIMFESKCEHLFPHSEAFREPEPLLNSEDSIVRRQHKPLAILNFICWSIIRFQSSSTDIRDHPCLDLWTGLTEHPRPRFTGPESRTVVCTNVLFSITCYSSHSPLSNRNRSHFNE